MTYVIWNKLNVTEGNINALSPDIVKNPVDQNPKSITSPLPKEGRTQRMTENR